MTNLDKCLHKEVKYSHCIVYSGTATGGVL